MRARVAVSLGLTAVLCAGAASGRSLESVRKNGSIKLCAHPNSLPYASKAGNPAGFQVELGRALATQLGVALNMDWIVAPVQIPRADCDIVLDTIADQEAQGETHLALSKSYYSSGVGLVVRGDSPVKGFDSLNGHTKVGVMVGSTTAMLLDQRGIPISMFGFEEDMLQALAAGEIDAAAVTPVAAGWFQKTHESQAPLVVLPPTEKSLTWNVAVGMRRPDDQLRSAIDAALDKLSADGTTKEIYARYGVDLHAPR